LRSAAFVKYPAYKMTTSSHCKTILSKNFSAIAERDSYIDREGKRIVYNNEIITAELHGVSFCRYFCIEDNKCLRKNT
jgi:hypothetical protein